MGDGDSTTNDAVALVIRWDDLPKYFEDLKTAGDQAREIEKYAKDQVFDKSGFDYDLCVLKPLADMMDTCGELFGDLRETFDERWEALVASLAVSAKEIEEADGIQGQGYLKAYLDVVES
ncbi:MULTISPECIES: hypothetical protein [Nocardioides]|jgi:hypothetical protein|uniref:hypothetical protein n=1 Tax=Nocardioides TaxID=1839 RepID=UPI00032E74A2|nr:MULTISPECIES: hypothetical protein [Nocardioides]EON25621.1 hypothetical protein CF8_0243 [Nocardioides sp. CF8]